MSFTKLFIDNRSKYNSKERRKKLQLGDSRLSAEFPKGDILITDGPFVPGTRSTIHLLLAVAPLRRPPICLSSLYIKSIPDHRLKGLAPNRKLRATEIDFDKGFLRKCHALLKYSNILLFKLKGSLFEGTTFVRINRGRMG